MKFFFITIIPLFFSLHVGAELTTPGAPGAADVQKASMPEEVLVTEKRPNATTDLGSTEETQQSASSKSILNKADEGRLRSFTDGYKIRVEDYHNLNSRTRLTKTGSMNENNKFADLIANSHRCSAHIIGAQFSQFNELIRVDDGLSTGCADFKTSKGVAKCASIGQKDVRSEMLGINAKRTDCYNVLKKLELRYQYAERQTKASLQDINNQKTYAQGQMASQPSQQAQWQAELKSLNERGQIIENHFLNQDGYLAEGKLFLMAIGESLTELELAIKKRMGTDGALAKVISDVTNNGSKLDLAGSANSEQILSSSDSSAGNGAGGFPPPADPEDQASNGKKSSNNWKSWAIGGAAVGGLALFIKSRRDKSKDKEQREKDLIEEQKAIIEAANDSIEEAEACSASGSENFPGCEGYLVDNCAVYYGDKYSPFALVEKPENSAPEEERVQYDAQERVSKQIQNVCGRFNTTYCGSKDEPSANSGGDYCSSMEERTYCMSSGNAESPTCIQLANLSNPICVRDPDTCEEEYSESYLASACEKFADDPICEQWIEDQIAAGNYPGTEVVDDDEEDVALVGVSPPDTVDGAENPFYTGNSEIQGFGVIAEPTNDTTEVLVMSSVTPAGVLADDIAPANAPSTLDAYSQAMQDACAAGQPYGCNGAGN